MSAKRRVPDGDVILDASFVVALLDADPAAERFSGVATRGRITAVNLGEVLYIVERESSVAPSEVEAVLAALGIEIDALGVEAARSFRSFPRLRALDAGVRRAQLAAGTPRRKVTTLSPADLCCLGHGLSTDLPVLTGDRHWTTLGLPIAVEDFRDPALVALTDKRGEMA